MRTPNPATLILTLVLAACTPEAIGVPMASDAPDLARVAAAGAGERTKEIHGTLETVESGAPTPGTPIVVRRLEGSGNASHLGRFTVSGTLTLNLATASGVGTSTYTAANGDVITVSSTGQAVIAAGIATVTESATVTGGTGRFAGATGTLTVVRRIAQATGIATGTIDGTISIPK